MEHFDCVVIGGGMVGAASALTLAQLGLKVALVEKFTPQAFSAEQPLDLRVSAISLASQNLLNQVGAWQQVKQWRSCPYKRLGVWEYESAYTEFNADDIEQSHLGHIVENRLIQLALWQQVTAMSNIHTYCPESLLSLNQDDDSGNNRATLTLTNSVVTAKLVIGADGAQSKVRQMSAIGMTGWDYQQSAMLINVETSMCQQDITWQKFSPTGPVAFLPLPGQSPLGGYASLVWYHQRDEITRLASLSNSQLQQEVLKCFPAQLGDIKVLAKGDFSLTRRHANTYQHKRVLLLGDAAHTINPMAGQGVNLGFKDVLALQHVIAEAIGNGEAWHDEAVLVRYEKMRRKDNLLMMSTMDALYAGFSHPSPLIKAARNLALLAVNKVPVLNSTIKNKALAYACGL
ncbi:FAD-dependent oxidoreductase [Colwellia psychrerythraea]|uniref:2-octaprenyl-3-methyl-6-methoxy-1,4-benzoquinol hydroxylase n=1 Tax=Colwellia psychrerythraea (strain 34H / ATCC BAA-681) TaxID=167879 RepID=Q47Y84_COLP3|nr:FAD-dependent oxidoreductase [Colwellia psychrerythraea]AAZ26975.1 2-octaprenyl-3-methyl-6-methoxy-1,4-benzoquinol hydroxylase [Colwellia psychrerythraea 34H]